MSCDHRLLYSDNPQNREKKSRNRKVFPISCLSVQRAMMWLHCSASDISRKCPQKSVGDTQGQRAPRLLKRNLPKSQHNGAKIGPNLTTFSEEKNWTKSFCLNKDPESQLKPNWGWKRRKYFCAPFSIDENEWRSRLNCKVYNIQTFQTNTLQTGVTSQTQKGHSWKRAVSNFFSCVRLG